MCGHGSSTDVAPIQVHGGHLAVSETPDPRTDRRPWAWPPAGRVAAIALAVATALAATAGAVFALRWWRIDLHVPLRYGGDAMLHMGYVQNMLETGWYLEGPRLGAPFGLHNYDYPLGPDQAHLLILRGLTLLTGDTPASVNLFYLLTFPLVALTALWVLRRLHVPAVIAMFGAVVYALLPYHFLRSEGHLFLSGYYTVPLSCYLVVATIEGRRFFGLGGGTNPRSRFARATDILAPTVLALLVASGGAYYATFTVILLICATLIAWLRTRSFGVLVSGGLLTALIAAFIALNSLPTLLYQLENGANMDVPVRAARETENHALRPTIMFLPVSGHRLEPFAALSGRYDAFPRDGERGEALGVIGAAGLAGLLLVAVGAMTGAYARGRRWVRHRGLAALTVIALGFAVTGGGSSLVALLISPQIRAWARLSIFIGFFALLAVCLVLGFFWRRARAAGWRPLIAVGVIALIGVAALDQTTDRYIPNYGLDGQRFMADRSFVQSVEGALPAGAAVYELPYRPYPEGGALGASADYDPMQPLLHSRQLRWSYGGMKGRESGWQLFVYGRQVPAGLPIVAAAGFSAVWFDRAAYAGGGTSVEASVRSALGSALLESPDGRYAVYDLQPYAAALRARVGEESWRSLTDAVVGAPVWVRWRNGVERATPNGCLLMRPATDRARLGLVNDGAGGRQQTVSFTLTTAHGPPSTVDITWPDGTVERLTTSDQALRVERTLTLVEGENDIEFSTDAPPLPESGDAAVVRLLVGDVWALDSALLELAGSDATC